MMGAAQNTGSVPRLSPPGFGKEMGVRDMNSDLSDAGDI